jgi:glucuronate isomerase
VTILHEDRLFPSEPTTRAIARRLYGAVRDLPILSPHGHTEARWFAENEPFPNPTSLFIVPDHYVFRMLYSQGIAMEDLGIGQKELSADEARRIWIRFAESYYLFRGTPTRMWLDFAFEK